jgi:uncharacterized protein YbjT (DUF2867 family)
MTVSEPRKRLVIVGATGMVGGYAIARVLRGREPNASYRLLRVIYLAFRVLLPNLVIRADDLARTMVDAAVRGPGEGGTLVLENPDIRRLALSSSARD